MTKNVLFYARYSTDRQDEQSIETQVALGREFVREHADGPSSRFTKIGRSAEPS